MKIENRELKSLFKSEFIQFLGFELKEKARYSKNDFLDLLIAMSLTKGFAEGTSNSLNVPNADTLLGYLKSMERNKIQELFDLNIRKISDVLKSNGDLEKSIPIAIDWHDVMYYGDHDDDMVLGTQHKNGSNYAFQYMTIVALVSGKRVILGVIPIYQRKDIYQLVIELIAKIRKSRIKIRFLTADKGFFDSRLIKFLKNRGIQYIIHMPRTKQIKKRELVIGKRFVYTTNNHKRSEQISFDVVVAYDEIKKHKYLFATNISYRANTILKLFRKRWGIETSYRVSNEFLARTTSKNYTIRMFLYMFAVLMYNLWVLLNYFFRIFKLRSVKVISLKISLISALVGVWYHDT